MRVSAAPFLIVSFVLCCAAGIAGPAANQAVGQDAGRAFVLDIEGVIGPATADYVSRGLDQAADGGAALVVLRMDTPGGLDTAMRDIVRAILAAPAPVATFVHPGGARAASAGTFILYASHLAAMTPGTNLGAATPVAIGGGGVPAPGRGAEEQPDDKQGGAMEAKAVNDAVAYIRSLAKLRGRNADWAESAVREAASLSATAAQEQGVIEIVARDLEDLLGQADGRTVTVADATVTLATKGLAVHRVEPNWRTRLLAAITNPNVALLLMTIGIYGLIFEMMNPGTLYPGIVGAISLLVALYALAALPVNYAGLGLIVLGVGLMTAEVFAPSFGILGIGGAAAFALGALILVDTDVPQFQPSWPMAAGIAAFSLGFSLLVLRVALRAHRRPAVSGQEEMIGARGQVLEWNGRSGRVFVHGERWNAVSATPLSEGQEVRITGLQGLTLRVEPDDANG